MSVLRFYASATLLLLVLMSGCAGDKDRLVLENKLRDQQATIRDLEQEVARSEQLLADQDKELTAMRDPAGLNRTVSGNVRTISSTSEAVTAWGSVASITIHRMTSGVLFEEKPERINVVIQPLDDDGELVKVAGQLKVTAATVDSDGSPKVVASKEIDITESRRLWTRTLMSSGFHVQMETSEATNLNTDILLTAVLNLGQGREFSTSELIRGK